MVEPDGVIEPVAELRLNVLLITAMASWLMSCCWKPMDLRWDLLNPCVGGHHQDHIAKICLAPVVVRQGTVCPSPAAAS
jgi:hypothetical protein